MQLLHQSHVEIEHYFVVYFDRIAAFKTLKRKTSVKGGTHMHYIDLSGIDCLHYKLFTRYPSNNP